MNKDKFYRVVLPIIISVIVLVMLGIHLFAGVRQKNTTLVHEVGKTLQIDVTDFFDVNEKAAAEITLDTSKVDVNKVGTYDYGEGLSSVKLYRVYEDGTEVLVKESSGLNGKPEETIEFVNVSEGVIRYKAVATDMKNNVAESYNTVYYDITDPTGSNIVFEKNGNIFNIELDVTDINPGE